MPATLRKHGKIFKELLIHSDPSTGLDIDFNNVMSIKVKVGQTSFSIFRLHQQQPRHQEHFKDLLTQFLSQCQLIVFLLLWSWAFFPFNVEPLI